MRASSRTPYLGPEVRRPFVLEAALDLFASAGYAGTSMSRVAKRSGISKAVVYDCFPGGKAEIFDALVAEAVRMIQVTLSAIPDEAASFPDATCYILGAVLRCAENSPSLVRLLFDLPGTGDDAIGLARDAARAGVLDRVATLLGSEDAERGELDGLVSAIATSGVRGHIGAARIQIDAAVAWLASRRPGLRLAT